MRITLLTAARHLRNRIDRRLARFAIRARPHAVRQPNQSGDQGGFTNVLLTAPFGSMGDDALRAGTAAAAASTGKHIKIWVPGNVEGWPHDTGRGRVHSLRSLRVGNSGFLNSTGNRTFGGADVIVIGADTISGDYLHGYLAFQVAVMRQAIRNGHRASLVNFSITAQPSSVALSLLRTIPPTAELWARDELSQQRAMDLLGRNVGIAPDVGALAKPVGSEMASQLAERLRGNGYICLSPNAHFETLGWFEKSELIEFWVSLSLDFLGETEIVLVPHDLRDRPGDIALCREIADEIRTRSGRTVDVFVPSCAGDAKYVLGHSDGLISGRMHACVGALSSGVPTVGLEYLGKFVGQFKWYGTSGTVLPLEESLDAPAAATALRGVMSSSTRGRENPIDAGAIGWLYKESVLP